MRLFKGLLVDGNLAFDVHGDKVTPILEREYRRKFRLGPLIMESGRRKSAFLKREMDNEPEGGADVWLLESLTEIIGSVKSGIGSRNHV